MIDTKHKVKRFIAEYSNQTENLVTTYDLAAFKLEEFQIEFNEPNTENLMLDCYPMKPENLEFLENFTTLAPIWDFSRKSYFVEARAIE